eukprot:596102-Hanusia_phi.AAC.2
MKEIIQMLQTALHVSLSLLTLSALRHHHHHHHLLLHTSFPRYFLEAIISYSMIFKKLLIVSTSALTPATLMIASSASASRLLPLTHSFPPSLSLSLPVPLPPSLPPFPSPACSSQPCPARHRPHRLLVQLNARRESMLVPQTKQMVEVARRPSSSPV